MSKTLEKWLAIALIALSLFLTGRMAVAMATSSLSTDEFGTVGSFSSKGPLTVMTDYRAPKNHVLFNLLNSLLPGRESLSTPRVRALSIAATVLTALVLIVWSARRGRWLEGAILLAWWSSAPQMLSLSMEARGYGFLGLFAVTAALAVIEYLRDRKRGWLWALGASVALGVYTIPGFLFFAAPLMLLLWLVERTRVTFVAGALTAAMILLLYAPLLADVFKAFTGFHQDKAEADFVSLHAFARVIKLYLFQGDDWEAWTLLALLALAPFATKGASPGESRALRVITGAGLAYFVTLWILRTPPLRIAAFALLPLGLAGLWAIGNWIRKPLLLRAGVFGLVGIFLLCHLAMAIATFRFTPTENWTLAGRAIDAAFPKTTHIDFKRHAKYLQKTLPDAGLRQSNYDEAAFAAGTLVVADAGNKWAEGSRFVPPAGLTRVVRWTIPGTIRDIALTFRLPETSGLSGQLPRELSDTRSETGVPANGLDLPVTPEAHARSLIVLFDRPVLASELQVDADGADVLLAGNAVVVTLPSGQPLETRLRVAKNSNLRATEAWTTR